MFSAAAAGYSSTSAACSPNPHLVTDEGIARQPFAFAEVEEHAGRELAFLGAAGHRVAVGICDLEIELVEPVGEARRADVIEPRRERELALHKTQPGARIEPYDGGVARLVLGIGDAAAQRRPRNRLEALRGLQRAAQHFEAVYPLHGFGHFVAPNDGLCQR